MQDGEDNDWLEGGAAEERAPGKGVLVNKSRLGELTGLSQATIDRALADGAPFVSKGTRKQGWRINVADFFEWYWRRKVELVTGDGESGGFEAAKTRDKQAQAEQRELELAVRRGELQETMKVVAFIGQKFGDMRSRALALPAQVPGLSEEQRDELNGAIHDLLSDVSGTRVEDWKPNVETDSSGDGEESDSEA